MFLPEPLSWSPLNHLFLPQVCILTSRMSHTLGQHPILVGCKSSLATLVLTAKIDSDSITQNQDRQWCFLMEQFSKISCTKRGKHKKRKMPGWSLPTVIIYIHDCEKAKYKLMKVLILSRGQNYYSGDNNPYLSQLK